VQVRSRALASARSERSPTRVRRVDDRNGLAPASATTTIV
jgi:hypothetical protein